MDWAENCVAQVAGFLKKAHRFNGYAYARVSNRSQGLRASWKFLELRGQQEQPFGDFSTTRLGSETHAGAPIATDIDIIAA